VSSIWTPGGEYTPEDEPAGGAAESAAGPGPAPDPQADPEVAEQLAQLRRELAATPVADIIANHAVGLWQLAVVHLAPEEGTPNLEEAQLAIDGMAALVEALDDRLGAHAGPLRDALAQLRLAFVEVSRHAGEA
jgi:hypothetical protein